jgi:phosphoheptose isomerase
MKFPNYKYNNIISYSKDYIEEHYKVFLNTNLNNLKKICELIEINYKSKNSKLMVCGNGGSAALANHFACDHQKILYSTKKYKPCIISLCANNALITAISNDIKYENVFSEQILEYCNKDSSNILLTISSSGKSKNIIKAISTAKKIGIKTISLTGFDGGKAKKMSDMNIHVKSNNYGIIESIHHSLMNIIAQYLKNKVILKSKIKKTIF